jgi:hypothetical protein
MAGDYFGGFCCVSYALVAVAGAIAAVLLYLQSRKKEGELDAKMKAGKPDNI